MTSTKYIGMDVHKESISIAVMNASGKIAMECVIQTKAKMPMDFSPGEKWSYSNTGYVLLGVIIHRVTGQFYGDFLQERIFKPLGMTSTRIISEADIVPHRSQVQTGKGRSEESGMGIADAEYDGGRRVAYECAGPGEVGRSTVIYQHLSVLEHGLFAACSTRLPLCPVVISCLFF
jgi:hypothetical protein